MHPLSLGDLLSSIADRGLSAWDPRREDRRAASPEKLATLCETLLSSRGEASGIAIARTLLDRYAALENDGRRELLKILATRFGADLETTTKAAERYLADPSQPNASRLHVDAEPRRQELIRRFNRAPGGTASLVGMRTDLLRAIRSDPALAVVDVDFRHLFASWFNRGFLVLRRVDWHTPAIILERIIEYEAVHEIGGFADLRSRVDAPDRRLYAFFHPALADDPLVFVEVALTRELPQTIDAILADDRETIDPTRASVAVFYSITNCQAGLKGVSFGSFLIKQVAEELRREIDTLKTFATLSPLPGFRRWLDKRGGPAPEPDRLPALAAGYLVREKRPDGQPLDVVARFHLGNGALLHRVNADANRSERGEEESYGIMVNYVYDLARIEARHEAYANRDEVAVGAAVRKLVRQAGVETASSVETA